MPVVLPGQEVRSNEPGRRFARHHHLRGYAALLVSGNCHEAGDSGRFDASAGAVLVHDSFHGHADRIGARGALFLNIALTRPMGARFGRVADVDAISRAFERDRREGERAFHEQFSPCPCRQSDWPDLLADALGRGTVSRLDDWARRNGIHPSSLSRGFRLAYGVTPQRFRLELMAARAARRISHGDERLADVAAVCGFADQAHMTRTLVDLFRLTPAALRRLS